MRGEKTPLDSVIESFLLTARSERTREWYELYCRKFTSWMQAGGKEATVGHLTPDIARSFVRDLELGVSVYTARAGARTLKRLAEFCAEPRPGQPDGIWSVRGISVLHKVKVPRPPKGTRRAYSDTELATIIEKAAGSQNGMRDQAIVAFLLGCGLRRDECRQLRPEHIDWTRKRVYVPALYTKGKRHPREVRLDAVAAKYLDRYLQDDRPDVDGPIFLQASGKAITRGGFGRIFWRLKERTGIKDFMAHGLRHTWATNFRRTDSGDLFDLQEEGGWADLDMPRHYSKARRFEERSRVTPLAGLMQRRAVA